MDEAKILELAAEAGLQKWADAYDPAIIAFARLVAAAEREECLAAATDDRDWDCFDGSFVANSIADAIRSRTE